MMKDLNFRELTPNEIDIRVGSTSKDEQGKVKGFQLLLYKDARVDANILDETVGAFNWQKRFYQVKNTMICSLGINMNYDDPSKEPYWVWKDDAGDESETEAIKGEASDAFKRAAFAFGGLGRALYTAPFVWIKVDSDNNPKTSRYSVSAIEYKDHKITKLAIVNDKTKEIVYSYGFKEKVAQNGENTQLKPQEQQGSIDKRDLETIETLVSNFQSENSRKSFYAWLDNNFNTMSLENLTYSQGKAVLKRLGAK